MTMMTLYPGPTQITMGYWTKRKYEPDFLQVARDMDSAVEHTTPEQDRDLSRNLFAQMTGRHAQRHPASDLDTQPPVLEFSSEVLPSPDLHEIVLGAGQVKLPSFW